MALEGLGALLDDLDLRRGFGGVSDGHGGWVTVVDDVRRRQAGVTGAG